MRVDSTAWLWHGRSRGIRFRRRKAACLRSQKDLRLRLRHGDRAHRNDEVRHQRNRAVLRRRYAVPGTVRMKILTDWRRSYRPELPVSDTALAEAPTLRGIAREGISD